MPQDDGSETTLPIDSTMTKQNGNIARRSAARLAAVQALYEIDMVGAPATPVLKEFLAKRWSDSTPIDQDDPERDVTGESPPDLPSPEQRFLKRLVNGVTENTAPLDDTMASHLNAPWSVGHLETLVWAILRAGTFELQHCPDVGARTIISEYVGLSHAFFNENEPALINAVLDSLAKQFRSDEVSQNSTHSS